MERKRIRGVYVLVLIVLFLILPTLIAYAGGTKALKKQLQTCNDAKATLETEKTQLQSENDRLKSEVSQLQSRQRENEAKVAQLETQIADYEALIARWTAELEAYGLEAEEPTVIAKTVEETLQQREAKIIELEADVKQMNQQLEQAKRESEQAKRELEQAKRELEQAKRELEQVKREPEPVKRELEQTKRELDQSKRDLAQVKRDLDQTKSELAQKISELQTTQKRLEQIMLQLDKSERELEQIRIASSLNEKTIEDLRAENEELLMALRVYEGIQDRTREMTDIAFERIQIVLRREIEAGQVRVFKGTLGITLDIVAEHMFNTGSVEINPLGKTVLGKIAPLLEGLDGYFIGVIGNADVRPIVTPALKKKYPTNWELSSARGAAVVRYILSRAKIDPDRMIAMGLGEFQPIDTSRTEEAYGNNRRVDIVLLPIDAMAAIVVGAEIK